MTTSWLSIYVPFIQETKESPISYPIDLTVYSFISLVKKLINWFYHFVSSVTSFTNLKWQRRETSISDLPGPLIFMVVFDSKKTVSLRGGWRHLTNIGDSKIQRENNITNYIIVWYRDFVKYTQSMIRVVIRYIDEFIGFGFINYHKQNIFHILHGK